VRIVVVGSGRMGTMRAQLLAAQPDVDAVMLAGRNEDRVAEIAKQLDVPVAPYDKIFCIGADGVVITTVTSSHPDLLLRAVRSGITTFCEKPLTGDPSQTEEIAGLAHDRGAIVQVGYHRRFDPGMQALHSAIFSGEAGVLYTIRMLSHDHQPSPREFIASSGGIFRDLHVHDFDLARWLTGSEVHSVFAQGSVRVHRSYEEYGDLDSAVILLTMADGLLATVSGARHNPTGYDVRVEVLGSRASLTAGLTARTPLAAAGEELAWGPAPPYARFQDRFAGAFAAETRSFVELLRGRRPNPCPPSEDLAAARIAVACERSRREGRIIEVT
jgi:myo-inositol 2-dehydrogenase / D-chiro-inositol 1-dehydrogenase